MTTDFAGYADFNLCNQRNLRQSALGVDISGWGVYIVGRREKFMQESVLYRLTQQAELLPMTEYLELIERLVHRLRERPLPTPKRLDWQPLYGLGKGLWHGEDAQEYVNRSREERV